MASDRMLEYYYAMGQDSVHLERYEEAVTYFRKAANMGASEAAGEICVLAHRFETGEGVPRDEERARLYYEISASYGDVDAALCLGRLYLRGVAGSRPNVRKARKCFEEASDSGNGEASEALGRMYDEGMLGRVNAARAFENYRLAAERGIPSAMLMTGMFYAQGEAAPKDLAEAEMWIRKGLAEGAEDGKETLKAFLSVAAGEYASGAAGRVDDDRAMDMAAEAEAMGNKEAFLTLGEIYRNRDRRKGHGERAFACFIRAARHEIPAAETALGLCYESGIGTAADIGKAVSLYQKAAGKGDAFAMARLGYAYAMGEGIEKDEQKAMSWLIKAALRGDAGAIHTLKEDYSYEL